MKIKKIFTVFIVFIITIPQCVFPMFVKANTTSNSGDLDISQGWTVIEYTSNIQPLVNRIFSQGQDLANGEVRGALVAAANIGDATLTVQKVIPMKKNHSYNLDLIYAQYYTNGGSGYIDFNGEKIVATSDSSDHQYKKTVTPSTDMDYKITVSFISKYAGNPYFKVAYNVKNGGVFDKQATVNVHDSNIYFGDSWKAQDNFDSALDKDGNPIDFSKVTVDDSKVDLTKAGTYDVTYTYEGVTSTAKVTFKAKQTAVNVHDSNIYVGDSWKAQDNFDSALDKDGTPIDFSKVTVDDSKVDTSKAGSYDVTYTYEGVTSTAKVTVEENQAAVNVHDSNIYVGDSWKAQDNFDSALDKDGNAVDFSKVTVDDSKVDTSKAGSYDVTYTYEGVTSTAKVTVEENQAAVNVHDSNLYVGDSWKAQDNFDSALDKDGNAVDFSKVTVDDSKVDTTKAGTYDVTYTYEGVTSTAKVTVEENQAAVNVHDSNLYVGDSWKAQDNFDSALDKDGNAVDFSKVTVDSSKVDTSKAGTYDVTYTYDGVTSTAKVTVEENQAAVNVHDSNIYVGDTWKAQDNFDSALNKNGTPIDFSQVSVDDSKVDTTKAGTYDVTYTYDGVTSTAKITVEKNSTHKLTPEKPTRDKTNFIPSTSSNDKASGKQINHRNNDNTKSSISKKSLPQTGDSNDKVLTLTGLSSMALLGLATFLKRRALKK